VISPVLERSKNTSIGRNDLGTVDVGAGVTSFTVAGVPPGRYFVRMKAVNFTGTSSPSTELIIDVPGQ
jgi:hypothetical protein